MKYLNETSGKLKLLLNIVVLIISLYGVSVKEFKEEESSYFQRFLVVLLSPLQEFIYSVRYVTDDFFTHYVLVVNAGRENEALKKKIKNLEDEMFSLKELKRENQRLKELLKFGEEIQRDKVLARVVGWDAASEFKVLRINKGSKDGIKEKSTVITSGGLVGHIYRLFDHYADVLTILDQNARVDGIVDRTRSHGIVQGFFDSKCLMKYVTRTEPVSIGDQIISAGLGNIYPKGLRIGTISNIERESYGITQIIEVTPSADFQKLEEVVVLIAPDNMTPELPLMTSEDIFNTGTASVKGNPNSNPKKEKNLKSEEKKEEKKENKENKKEEVKVEKKKNEEMKKQSGGQA